MSHDPCLLVYELEEGKEGSFQLFLWFFTIPLSTGIFVKYIFVASGYTVYELLCCLEVFGNIRMEVSTTNSTCNTPTYHFEINKFVKLKFSGKLKPSARSGHRSVADDNHIWLIGGYNNSEADNQSNDNDSFPLFREFWRYNISTREWTLLQQDENMPHELASHSAIRQDNHMLVFGGTGVPFGERSSDQLTACHLHTGRWNVVKSTGIKPEKIYGQAMAFIGSYLYIYGGTTGYVYNTELHRLDLNNLEWDKLIPKNICNELPPERYRHEIACDDDHIYVLGGGTSQIVYSMHTVHYYSIKDNTWKQAITKPDAATKSFPRRRRCHSCVQLDKKAYICGGYDGESILGDLWQFDLETLQWTKLADMPEPVYFHSAAVTSEGCMIVFGGVSCIRTTTRTDSCYQIWLKVPSLQTMCWLTLLNTYPELLKMSRHELLQLGISRNFINKLPCAEGA